MVTSPAGPSYVTATLANCTFAGNATLGVLAGGAVSRLGRADLILKNAILSANSAAALYSDAGGGALTVDYSCTSEGAPPAGTGNLASCDPLFSRAPSDGGDGWGTPNDDFGDLRLGAGSVCVDAADAAALPIDRGDLDGDAIILEPTPLDRANLPRTVDDAGQANTGAGSPLWLDMGAYERQ